MTLRRFRSFLALCLTLTLVSPSARAEDLPRVYGIDFERVGLLDALSFLRRHDFISAYDVSPGVRTTVTFVSSEGLKEAEMRRVIPLVLQQAGLALVDDGEGHQRAVVDPKRKPAANRGLFVGRFQDLAGAQKALATVQSKSAQVQVLEPDLLVIDDVVPAILRLRATPYPAALYSVKVGFVVHEKEGAPPTGDGGGPLIWGDVLSAQDNHWRVRVARPAQGSTRTGTLHLLPVEGTGMRITAIDTKRADGVLGLQPGDVVQTINDIDVSTPEGLLQAYRDPMADYRIEVVLERAGKPITLEYMIDHAYPPR